MTRLWAELRAPEFSDLGPETIAILPVGSAEQHGPHLPLNTDFVIADSLARDVVAGHGDELGLLLLPSLAVSKSNEHAWSPGTLWLSAPTLLAVQENYNRRLQAALATTVYNAGGCASTYLTERGHNSFCWPWSTARLTQEMGRFDADDYTVTAQPAEPLQDGQPEAGIAVLD